MLWKSQESWGNRETLEEGAHSPSQSVARRLGVAGRDKGVMLRTHSSACSEISCRNIHGQKLDGSSTSNPPKGGTGASLGFEFRAERTIHTREDRTQIRWRWHWDYPVSPWPRGSKTASFLASIPEPVSRFLALVGSCCHFADFVLPWLLCVCVIRDGYHLKTLPAHDLNI